MPKCDRKIFVCAKGKKCRKKGSADLFARFVELVDQTGVDACIVGTKCLGMCKHGPSVVEMPGKTKHKRVSLYDAEAILAGDFSTNPASGKDSKKHKVKDSKKHKEKKVKDSKKDKKKKNK